VAFARPTLEHDATLTPRTEALWRWAFQGNPAGSRSLVAEHSGELLGYVAGFPVPMLVDGLHVTWTCVVDVVGRDAQVVEGMWAGFEERFGAAGGEKDRMFFALPGRARACVEHAALGFEVVRNQEQLRGIAQAVSDPTTLPWRCARLRSCNGASRSIQSVPIAV
jgi:hypothetical protein